MSFESHIQKLVEKHRALDDEIKEAARRPGSDDLDLQLLKKQKLRLKEKIERSRATAA